MSLREMRPVLLLGTAVALAGCQMSAPKLGGADKTAAVETSVPGDSSASTPEGGERDVENPKLFDMTAKALWDGRPSLGGVWVAHASVQDPRRVIIRNPGNGKTVVGALFRREIDNPGPPLQLSSDAADALGMLAGQPATIQVTALDRVEEAAPEAPKPAAVAAATPTAKGADAKVPEVAAAEAAAAKTGTAPAVADAAAAAPAAEKPKSKISSFFGGLLPGRKKAADAPGATDAAPAIEAAALPPANGATTATAAAKTQAPATPAKSADPELKRPYVQIGIFSVEANAKTAAAQMGKAGLTAQVRPDQSQGKTFWRVIIGPATSVAERDQMAAKVKSLGYPDSYPVVK